MLTLWWIWHFRNKRIHGEDVDTNVDVLYLAREYLETFRAANSFSQISRPARIIIWQPPQNDFLKRNVSMVASIRFRDLPE